MVNKKTNEADFAFVGPVGYCFQFTRLKAVFTFMSKLGNTWRKSSGRGLQRGQLGFYELSRFEAPDNGMVIGMVASMQICEVL